jgi:addiction module RelE/StbE family toxin
VKLVWSRTALADRREIRTRIKQDNPAAAVTLDGQFSEMARHLSDHPELGKPGRVPSTRELIAHQNYIMIYDIDGDRIRILRILHAARRWPPVSE